MSALAERLARGPVLRLDWLDYAERLLGPADWGDPASLAALYGKAQALLPSDIVVLPLARIVAAHLAGRAGLRSAMAERLVGAQPLRALLADTALQDGVAATLQRLGPGLGGALLALSIPAPVAFAQLAAAAVGAPTTLDEDLADDAAVYVAAFLRSLAGAPIALLLIEDGPDDPPFRAFAAPIHKVADHYGWQTGDAGVTSAAVPPDTAPEDALALVARLRSDAGGRS